MQGSIVLSKLRTSRPTVAMTKSHCARSPQRRVPARRYFGPRATAEDVDAMISGEWPATWSLLEYEDVLGYYQRKAAKQSGPPSSRLKEYMMTSEHLITCGPEDYIDSLKETGVFDRVSGLPVVRPDGVLLGVLSRSDLNKPGARVGDIMSSPPVAAGPNDTTAAAACLMLKYKVHRLPIVDKEKRCIGLVTRSDVFTALAVDSCTDVNHLDM